MGGPLGDPIPPPKSAGALSLESVCPCGRDKQMLPELGFESTVPSCPAWPRAGTVLEMSPLSLQCPPLASESAWNGAFGDIRRVAVNCSVKFFCPLRREHV